MRVGDTKQALGVGRGQQGALEVVHRLAGLAERITGAAQVGQDPRSQSRFRVLASVQPVKASHAGLDRRVELLLGMQDRADLDVYGRVELRIVARRGGSGKLVGSERVRKVIQRVICGAAYAEQVGALVGRRVKR